jgi:hypothetical protein
MILLPLSFYQGDLVLSLVSNYSSIIGSWFAMGYILKDAMAQINGKHKIVH